MKIESGKRDKIKYKKLVTKSKKLYVYDRLEDLSI